MGIVGSARENSIEVNEQQICKDCEAERAKPKPAKRGAGKKKKRSSCWKKDINLHATRNAWKRIKFV